MSPHPEWALQHKRPGTELHRINNRYYLYEVSSKWDTERKKTKKVSGKILGSITPEGFFPSRAPKARSVSMPDFSRVAVKEYGVSCFLLHHFADIRAALESFFPGSWQFLLALTYNRLLFQSPINQMPFHFSHSFLSEEFPGLPFTEKNISLFLRDLGRDRGKAVAFMRSLSKPGQHILLDMTDISSKSSHIALCKEGYNRHEGFSSQFNLLYAYSIESQAPAFFRLLPGNIREVRAFSLTLKESGIERCTIVADKGFYSKKNVKELCAEGLTFIIPLRRDSKLIDASLLREDTFKSGGNYFPFEARFVWHNTYETPDKLNVFLFMDEWLKANEEKDFLARIQKMPKKYNIKQFHQQRNSFGTLAMLTNCKGSTASETYASYKSRANVETMFDSLKNVIEADRTYMQNEETLQGWMFINHLALIAYYKLYQTLLAHDKLSKFSVNALLQHLAEIRKVKINDQWVKAESIEATQKLLAALKIPVT